MRGVIDQMLSLSLIVLPPLLVFEELSTLALLTTLMLVWSFSLSLVGALVMLIGAVFVSVSLSLLMLVTVLTSLMLMPAPPLLVLVRSWRLKQKKQTGHFNIVQEWVTNAFLQLLLDTYCFS